MPLMLWVALILSGSAYASDDPSPAPEARVPRRGMSLLETLPQREFILHGFRAPVTGVELREGPLGFHLGVYPTILGDDGVTTWFTKMGLSLYFLSFAGTAEGRESGFVASVSLMQGLSGDRAVTLDLQRGTAFAGDLAFRWAVWKGLDLRIGVSLIGTAAGELFVNPTPGVSWSVPLGAPPVRSDP